MPFKLFDIGANLTHKSFENDFEEVIKKSLLNGVSNICITGCDLTDSRRALSLAKKFPNNLISTCGIHPHYADSFSEKSEKEIQEICNDSLVKAIGETGLDYFYSKENIPLQKKSFIEHIKISQKTKLPLIIHLSLIHI